MAVGNISQKMSCFAFKLTGMMGEQGGSMLK